MEEIQERRQQIFATYQSLLEPLADEGMLRLPVVPRTCDSNCHMFYILLNDAATRDEMLVHLRSQGIAAVFHIFRCIRPPSASGTATITAICQSPKTSVRD